MNDFESSGSIINPPTFPASPYSATDAGSMDTWYRGTVPVFRSSHHPSPVDSTDSRILDAVMRRRASSQAVTVAAHPTTTAQFAANQSSMSPTVAAQVRRANIRAFRVAVAGYIVLLGTTVIGCLVGEGHLPFAP